MCRVVHVRDRVPGAVFIGRPGPYGNPFIIGRDGTRDDVIRKFRTFMMSNPVLAQEAAANLRGKDLACFCAPLPCHGDVILEIANSDRQEPDNA